MNSARWNLGGSGASNTAAIAYAGGEANPSVSNKTETYNGSSWTETTDLNTARSLVASTGLDLLIHAALAVWRYSCAW